ncbi:helix-turn-helix domain-containing protein [Micromonospora sp. C28SCA-DRY-2]|uniref:helix-turn-helix domain-containing protein n=1 Tax=Micromonospora sp. C28SCA-DRY-2 TaxID=3059522 RepID=UPI002674A068|nr:helix-turn-helix domain-containing protein [Micromonospora sp. C28SCA-DRY-2]MDO3704753.1 helix-turn-helix domain-containing protein [Micromonospora sp. C28SCA-DRY-2]
MDAVATAVDEVVLGVPHARLRPFVDRYIGYRERADLPLVRREVAGAFVVVILGWGAPLDVVDPRDPARGAHRVDSFVAGTFDGPCTTRLVGVGEGVELLLAPLAARRILGLPLAELTNRAVGVAALPGGWLDRLRVRLATAADWPARFALLDAAVTARLAATEPVDARLAWAWQRLAGSGGRVAVGALASELGWSRRHLAARFRDEIGLPPKTTARLLRFQRAYATLAAGPALGVDRAPAGTNGQAGPGGESGSVGQGGTGGPGEWSGPPAGGWAEVAARCGYYDQSHLIRDFREFAGGTPTALGSHSSNPG